jgi:hypothetical protein
VGGAGADLSQDERLYEAVIGLTLAEPSHNIGALLHQKVPMRVSAPRLTLATAIPLFVQVAALAIWPTAGVVAQEASRSVAAAGLSPELVRARAALDKYQDPVVAVHDGYLSTVGCIEYTKGGEGTMHYAPGGMGVHFLNLQLIGAAALDPAKPQVLIYEPEGDRLRLAAAEWFVPVGAAGQRRPTIFGQELQGPMEGHVPLQPKGFHHYDLHVWLWTNNPAGVFSATNPAVKCPKQGYSFAESPPKLVGHQEP